MKNCIHIVLLISSPLQIVTVIVLRIIVLVHNNWGIFCLARNIIPCYQSVNRIVFVMISHIVISVFI